MQAQSSPVRFWQGPPPRHVLVPEPGQAIGVSLADIAAWVASLIEADAPPNAPISLEGPFVDVAAVSQTGNDPATSERPRTSSLPLRTSMVQVPARHAPKAAAPLANALKHASSNWKDHWRVPREALAWRERTFAGRRFLLWVEDTGSQECAMVHACDEASGAIGSLCLPDFALRAAFKNFTDARIGGLVGALGIGSIHRARTRPSRIGPLLHEFLEGLLDAIYFEANPLRDEWAIKLSGLGPPSQAEELGDSVGPDIELASRPGVAAKPLQDKAPQLPRSGAGRTPSGQGRSPLQRRRLERRDLEVCCSNPVETPHESPQSAYHTVKEYIVGLGRRENRVPLASRLRFDMENDVPPMHLGGGGSLLASQEVGSQGAASRRPIWRPSSSCVGELFSTLPRLGAPVDEGVGSSGNHHMGCSQKCEGKDLYFGDSATTSLTTTCCCCTTDADDSDDNEYEADTWPNGCFCTSRCKADKADDHIAPSFKVRSARPGSPRDEIRPMLRWEMPSLRGRCRKSC